MTDLRWPTAADEPLCAQVHALVVAPWQLTI